MKGVSTIIASIIMVVITIGLISVAYLFMSGLLTGKTAGNIKLEDAYCASGTLYFIIRNIGTTNITLPPTVVLRGTPVNSLSIQCGSAGCGNPSSLAAGSSIGCQNCSGSTYPWPIQFGTTNDIRIIGPSNSVGGPVPC